MLVGHGESRVHALCGLVSTVYLTILQIVLITREMTLNIYRVAGLHPVLRVTPNGRLVLLHLAGFHKYPNLFCHNSI